MPITFTIEKPGEAVFNVSGIITVNEMQDVQKQCEQSIPKTGKQVLLVLIDTSFEGWSKQGDWSDTSFAERNDPLISKIAFVGESKWRELVYVFALKGLRSVAIEYFNQEDVARYWLAD